MTEKIYGPVDILVNNGAVTVCITLAISGLGLAVTARADRLFSVVVEPEI